MRVGFVGLGKLGLPCALASEAAGHTVMGWDVSYEVQQILRLRELPYQERDAQELLAQTNISLVEPEELSRWADIIFVAVQTPHQPKYEGATRLPVTRSDFDYTWLKEAVRSVSDAQLVVVISTVLPGTMGREILPIVGAHKFLYNPFFIAMGTTIPDFRDPEFVLVGTDQAHPEPLREFYAAIHDRPVFVTTVKTAELTKVAYNTYIGMKIAFANTMMELCEKTGADVDDLVDALSMANRRLMGPAYLRGGMGDGGGCFPPGEMVMTVAGPRPIETISEGDLVLTGDGTLQPVLKTWRRYYEGTLISVKTQGLLRTRMTDDHPVIAREDLRDRYANGRRRTDVGLLSDPHEVDADKLIPGQHRLTWPRAVAGWHSPIPPPHATDEYLELAGWWLSEGSAELSERRGRLRFDLHADEKEDARRIGELLEACAPPRRSGRGENATLTHKVVARSREVRFGSMGLTEQLVVDFGKGAREKFLPGWVLWGGERIAAIVLSGMVKGDGHVSVYGISYSTISPDLAWGAVVLMSTLGANPTIREIPERPGHQHSYEVRVRNRREARDLARKIGVEFDEHGRHEVKSQPWRPVREVRPESYSGQVHNLWVAGTNTYVVGCGVVHNCHPRDNIALSWLARKVDLSYDLFGALMECREKQTEWLADLIEEDQNMHPERLPIEILGKAYKPETNLTIGSPATLLANILGERQIEVEHTDPFA